MVMEKDSRGSLTGTTPVGEVIWAQLASPSRRYKDAGEYRVIMRLPTEQAQELIGDVGSIVDEEFEYAERACRNPREKVKLIRAYPSWETEYDEKSGEETGSVKFRFKANASGITRDGREWTLSIPVFDRRGRSILPVPQIGPGSEVRVAYELRAYNSAAIGIDCSCRLKAVQLFKLIPQKSRKTAADFGFNYEEADEADILWEKNPFDGNGPPF